MTENEVGKIALLIEKEMFNLFRVTDNRYKSKYRSLMFNLKDPKNQVCARPLGVGQPWPGAAPGLWSGHSVPAVAVRECCALSSWGRALAWPGSCLPALPLNSVPSSVDCFL